jgi:hypothetical protein
MKLLIIGLSILAALTPFFCTNSYAGTTDDLLLQTKTNPASLDWIIDRTQVILSNSAPGPTVSGTTTIDSDPVFTMHEMVDNPSFIKLQTTMSQIFHADLNDAVLRVRIPSISYEIGSIQISAKKLKVDDPILSLATSIAMRGVDIGLVNGIQLDLMIPDPKTHELQSFLTAMVDPVSISVPSSLPPANFDLTFQALRDKDLHFDLTQYDLDSLPTYIHDHTAELVIKTTASDGPLTVDQIKINPVTIRLGNLSRTVQFDDFKPLVQAELGNIIGSVLFSVGNGLKTAIGPQVLNALSSFNVHSDFELSNDSLYAKYVTGDFTKPSSNQVAFSVKGASCTHDLYAQYQAACVEHNPPFEPVRIISDEDHASAKKEITQKIETGGAGLALSISEEYLNQLLKTTIDAKLWEDTLKSDDLTLGDKGAFVVFNQSTQNPDLILDLYYSGDGKGAESMFINKKKPLHFPLRMSIAPTLELRNGIPFLVLKTVKVNSDTSEIINGIPQYGMSSKLVWGLKTKIAKMVLQMAEKMQGQTALEMDLPILKGTGLESAWFEVSQYGRLNMYLKPLN